MSELHLVVLFYLAFQCSADNISLYKSVTGKRSNFTSIFQNISSVSSEIECGRRCKGERECLSASLCGSNCHLSNASTDSGLEKLEDDVHCIHMELITDHRNKTSAGGIRRVSCPSDFIRLGNLCVKYLANVPYGNANSTCFARAGHLVTVDSNITMHVLLDYCRGIGCHHVWIDGKGNAIWDGKPLPFEQWHNGIALRDGECPVICTLDKAMKSEPCEKGDNQAYCQIDVV